MPLEEIAKARFDHVSDQGDLVFACGLTLFAVSLDNTLDHAILEARQILEEEHGTPIPQASSALPISAIQAAVRAGESTEQVAKEFAVNEAIVRRFATPIETEKKYAIEQFLSMSAPKRGSGYSNEEAINRALEAVDVSMSAITWSATRRNHSPWKIRASFQASGHAVQADWTWNMKENTITCLNTPARELLEGSISFITSVEEPQEVAVQESSAQYDELSSEEQLVEHDFVEEQASEISNEHPTTTAPTVEISTLPAAPSVEIQGTNDQVPGLTPAAVHQDLDAPAIAPVVVEPQPQDGQTSSSKQDAEDYPVPPPSLVQTPVEAAEPDNASQTSEPTQAQDTPEHEEPEADSHAPNPLTAWMYGSKRSKSQTNKTPGKTAQPESKPTRTSTSSPKTSPAQQPKVNSPAPATEPSKVPSTPLKQARQAASTSSATVPADQQPQQQARSNEPSTPADEPSIDNKDTKQPKEQGGPHKRAGRSAVPSWDEILFGE
ncbi:hypothetical protein KIMH_08970 [Bombiscardovia apis]|uniref:DUF3071 domain-containing protein n=1 Tax=Bombiscardovia apis TaxID=2932182 RepID=A0ABM8BD29_9BIFI|nr:septation protein SepH [Bombiscardovia apis]BDR54786.1 hypothetical protein KIMH_08970 [Bombiscardovia apis]